MLPVAKDREHPADGDRYRIVRSPELDMLEIGRYKTIRSITSAAACVEAVHHGDVDAVAPANYALECMQQEERSVFPRQPGFCLGRWDRFSSDQDIVSVLAYVSVLLIGQTT
jgi:hypothetical protein